MLHSKRLKEALRRVLANDSDEIDDKIQTWRYMLARMTKFQEEIEDDEKYTKGHWPDGDREHFNQINRDIVKHIVWLGTKLADHGYTP